MTGTGGKGSGMAHPNGVGTDMPGAGMTVERALAIVEAHGADTGRWPTQERDALMALVEKDDRLATVYREAQSLDRVLDTFGAQTDVSHVPEALRARILADAADETLARVTQERAARKGLLAYLRDGLARADETARRALSLPGFLRPGSVLAASAVLGLGLGLVTPSQSQSLASEADVEFLMMAFGGSAMVEGGVNQNDLAGDWTADESRD